MQRFATSDTHFGHRLVAEKRGFVTYAGDGTVTVDTDAHDEAIIRNWNEVVAKEDITYVLGDITLRDPKLIWHKVDRLNGVKILVAGNHDAVHGMHRTAWKFRKEWMEHFHAVLDFARVRLEGQDVLMSHFPYRGDRNEERYTQYRLRDEGLTLLHGHTHSEDKGEGRQIHVGLDAWGLTPVSLDDISKVIRERNLVAA